jgi:hypothetical protein
MKSKFEGGLYMEITSIMPAIKVTKENNMMGSEEYFSLGSGIKVTDLEGEEFIGVLICMDLAEGEEDDILLLDVAGENVEIQCVNIKNIEYSR